MNPFLKAGVLTAVVVMLAFLLVSQIDSARSNELKKSVEAVLAEKQAEEVLHSYAAAMARNPEELCPYLSSLREKQLGKTYSIAERMQNYERSNLLNDEYEMMKVSYFLGLAQMYVSGFENRKTCDGGEVPLVFFYAEKETCADCMAQNAILSKVGERCKNVRIYAFPFDSELEPVSILVGRYEIKTVPSIVIDDGTALMGVQSEAELVGRLAKSGASCE
ncbi:hypothetical protein COV61_02610 [Candidatus Micrarchaeota archaeon CG11_big_fil_rev_8_21_14_0_20_47_5]|nr:MAG: hypothetical protein AUJ17_00030 [Candidatus Micrarchaeota archaeon CG1_02_47_40]PIN83614.1 MAG: hypothetical protein COV61_02610 [Candidatus Micrarchaeota archaeon CG11_big_fil_rev_8_21_14_0_20_47_5]